MTKKLDGKIALVTGASRGIGYAIARELGRQGAHVIAVARTVGGLEELDDEIKAAGSSATLVPFDLKEHDGIDHLGQSIYDRWGKLDILVGNAGILGTLSPLGHIEPKDWDEVMSVNVTANWRLIRSLDPLLRQSDAARAVFLTSNAAHLCFAYWGTYSTSKAALDALVKTYAAEVETTNIRVNMLSPGPVNTAMRSSAMPGEDKNSLTQIEDIARVFVPLVSPELEENGTIFHYRDGALVTD